MRCLHILILLPPSKQSTNQTSAKTSPALLGNQFSILSIYLASILKPIFDCFSSPILPGPIQIPLLRGQHQIILKKVISLIYIDIVSNLDSMEELSQKHFLCVTVFYSLIHCLPLPSILGRVTARVWIYQITILLLAKTFETCISFAALQYFSFCIYPFSQCVLLLLRPRRLRHERVRLLFLIQICVLDPLNALVPPSDYIKVR